MRHENLNFMPTPQNEWHEKVNRQQESGAASRAPPVTQRRTTCVTGSIYADHSGNYKCTAQPKPLIAKIAAPLHRREPHQILERQDTHDSNCYDGMDLPRRVLHTIDEAEDGKTYHNH